MFFFQELQCSPEDCSFHQQWLMFTFALGHGKTPLQKSVFVVGRQISALVVKNVQDVQTCLRLAIHSLYTSAFSKVGFQNPDLWLKYIIYFVIV